VSVSSSKNSLTLVQLNTENNQPVHKNCHNSVTISQFSSISHFISVNFC